MKKIFLILVLINILSANSLEYYLFSVDMNYQENDSKGAFLDGDYNNFGKLNGLGIKLTDIRYSVPLYLKGEFAYGTSTYSGYTWGGDYLSIDKKNVYLLNIEGGVFPFKNPYYFSLGFRLWNRGKGDYSGDYDEVYYWPYFSAGIYNVFDLYFFYLSTDFSYQYAFMPKLNVLLGSGTTLSLNTTTGYKLKIKAFYKYSNNIMLMCYYKYQLWHITGSSVGVVNYAGQNLLITEPESYTKNQYLGIGILYRY